MRFDVLTIFPNAFDSYLNESILLRARKRKFITVAVHDIRAFAEGRHRKVDDSPYGGGPGMVLQVGPIYRAVEAAKLRVRRIKRRRVILFSTRGKVFTSHVARRLARTDQLILICGRYEGVDERVAEHIADEEISIGDFVLSGGELAALVVIEAVARFIPGVIGKSESLEEVKGSYPVYTKPEVFHPLSKVYGSSQRLVRKKWIVPDVLLSGDHNRIAAWRRAYDDRKR